QRTRRRRRRQQRRLAARRAGDAWTAGAYRPAARTTLITSSTRQLPAGQKHPEPTLLPTRDVVIRATLAAPYGTLSTFPWTTPAGPSGPSGQSSHHLGICSSISVTRAAIGDRSLRVSVT